MQDAVWGNIFLRRKKSKELIDLLGTLPMFDRLSRGELYQVERLLHLRQYKKDETVFQEEEPGACMYVVKDGAVGICRQLDGQNIELAALEDGTFFGEMALLDESPRSATAKALKESTLLAFSKPDFEELLERSPKLGAKILVRLGQILSQRLRKSNDNIEYLQAKQLENGNA